SHGHEELHRSAHAVAAVGEITVVAGGDEEHAHDVEDAAQDQGACGYAGEDGGQAHQVDDKEGGRRHPVQALVRPPYIGDGHGPTLAAARPPYLPVGRVARVTVPTTNIRAKIPNGWTSKARSRCRGWWPSFSSPACAAVPTGSTGSYAPWTPCTGARSGCGC